MDHGLVERADQSSLCGCTSTAWTEPASVSPAPALGVMAAPRHPRPRLLLVSSARSGFGLRTVTDVPVENP